MEPSTSAGSGARVKGADLDSDSRTKGSSREFKGSADHNRAFRATRQGKAREDARNSPSKEADGKEKEAQKKPYQPRFKIVAGRIVPVDIVNEEGTPVPQPSSSRMDGSTSAAPHPNKLDSQPARQHRNGRAPPKNGKNVPARDKKVEETQCRNKDVQDQLKRTGESKSPSHMQRDVMNKETQWAFKLVVQEWLIKVAIVEPDLGTITHPNPIVEPRGMARIMRSQTSKSVQECNQPASQHRDGKLPLKNKNNVTFKDSKVEENRSQNKDFKERVKRIKERKTPSNTKEGTPEPQPSSSRMDGSTSAAPHPNKLGPKLDSQPARQHRNGRAPPKNGKNVPARDRKVKEAYWRNMYIQDWMKRIEEAHMQETTLKTSSIMDSSTSVTPQPVKSGTKLLHRPAAQRRNEELGPENNQNFTFEGSKGDKIRRRKKELPEGLKLIEEGSLPSYKQKVSGCGQLAPDIREVTKPKASVANRRLILRTTDAKKIEERNKETAQRMKQIEERKKMTGHFLNKETTLKTSSSRMDSSTSVAPQPVKSGTKLLHRPAAQRRNEELGPENNQNFTFEGSKGDKIRRRKKKLPEGLKLIEEGSLPSYKQTHDGATKAGGTDLKEEVSNVPEPEVLARSCGGGSTAHVEYSSVNAETVSGSGQQASDRPSISRAAEVKKIKERNKVTGEMLKQIYERKMMAGDIQNENHGGTRKRKDVPSKEKVSHDEESEAVAGSCGGGSIVEKSISSVNVEGRTSSKRSNARVDGPNLRSPPVSEDWEEKEVPYSDGDNRRHCTLDQINVKDNNVDEKFRTLPETQHHSTLESEMLIKPPKGIYRSYTRWRQTLYLADSEVAQHSLEKGHVINLVFPRLHELD
ncbi:hypothetical protein AAG570_006062 [Ranatra chinensis]|uniref:Uncharacterized protein n=1 Tax=Ranatra chinensis TaxID=642074 RepID=A0ABD0XWX2_9HEMI